jgi:ribosomal-protein-alanine N-acetyltransferase
MSTEPQKHDRKNSLTDIETARLVIRCFRPSDAEDLYAYLRLPEIYRFEPGVPISLETARTLAAERSIGQTFLAVALKPQDKLVGHLYFEQIAPPAVRTWELGYIFNPEYQHRGYASEAAAALVRYAFVQMGAHRIMARCDPRNRASWKLLERIGFMREGHFRQAGCIHMDEQGQSIWNDVYEYSLLEGDGHA